MGVLRLLGRTGDGLDCEELPMGICDNTTIRGCGDRAWVILIHYDVNGQVMRCQC